jgi:flagellar biosynthesis chaperone FliJ
MNYIHQLQNEVKENRDALQDFREALQDLRAYLQSDKFRCGDSLDGYVNVQDVLNRLPN